MPVAPHTPGELYFIGERDLHTQQDTPFFKIGIVREKENRTSSDRVLEHQTGNPRPLHVVQVLQTPIVEKVETFLHGLFAPDRVAGEWFYLPGDKLNVVVESAKKTVEQAKSYSSALTDESKLKSQIASGPPIEPSYEQMQVYIRCHQIRAALKHCSHAAGIVTNAMVAAINSDVDVSRWFTLQKKNAQEKFDEKALEKDHHDIWSRYVQEGEEVRGSFLLTSPKNLDAELDVDHELEKLVLELEALKLSVDSGQSTIGELHSVFLQISSREAALTWESDQLQTQLRVACGISSEIIGVCKWDRQLKVKTKFDKKAFKNDHPDLFSQFVTVETPAPSQIIHRHRGFAV
jgi:hypothetical protein